IDGRLVLTDLDGRVEGEAAWQPTGRDRIAEVVTDGETVVTWQPPCTLEAGSLVHGTSVPLGTEGACNGPAAIDETTGTIMWLSGPSVSAAGEDRSVVWFEQTATSARAGGFVMPGLLEADDRVVGIDGQEGSTRLLVRRTGADWVEVLALPMEQLDDGTWEPPSGPGGAVELRPAFTHVDGYVPLDVAGDWVLDARWTFADGGGSAGTIEEVRIRTGDEMGSWSTSAVLSVDPMAVWFDATGEATIWGHGDERDPEWTVSITHGDAGAVYSGTTTGGVTAAAFLPGSLTEPIIPAPPPLGPPPTRPPTAIDEGWAATWCGEASLVGIATTTDPDGVPLALCEDGQTPPLVGGGFGWTHPSVAAGGFALAAEGGDGHAPAFTVLGQDGLNIEGATPALSAIGGLAWTSRSLDATTIHAVEQRGLADDVHGGYVLSGDLTVTHMSWARDSRFLFVTTRSDADETRAWVIDTAEPAAVDAPTVPDPRVRPIEPPAGRTILAAAGEIDTTGAGVLLTAGPDGTVHVAGVLVAEGSDPLPHARITTLAEIAGEVAEALTAADATPTVTAVGVLTPDDDGAWVTGSTIAWLVGDGRRVWHVPAGEPPTLYRDDIAEIAIDPSLP
ncbi:MAG TPA: hypothetical protein VMM13_07250, partial [Euzebya sp.]|nr:hypothetical protein [Euzebya sp.]